MKSLYYRCAIRVLVAENEGQVKFPRFNEIVTLTLPDGSERSGQVLEARGRTQASGWRWRHI